MAISDFGFRSTFKERRVFWAFKARFLLDLYKALISRVFIDL